VAITLCLRALQLAEPVRRDRRAPRLRQGDRAGNRARRRWARPACVASVDAARCAVARGRRREVVGGAARKGSARRAGVAAAADRTHGSDGAEPARAPPDVATPRGGGVLPVASFGRPRPPELTFIRAP